MFIDVVVAVTGADAAGCCWLLLLLVVAVAVLVVVVVLIFVQVVFLAALMAPCNFTTDHVANSQGATCTRASCSTTANEERAAFA